MGRMSHDRIHDTAQDFRYGIRCLLRSPVFSATAILTLALGIGVNVAVFNVIYAVLLAPLPYRDAQRLVHVAETHPDFPSYQVAVPDFLDWRKRATSLEGMAAYTFRMANDLTINDNGEPESVVGVQASASLFPLLGAKPLIGRFYSAEEEKNKSAVVLLSESLWRRKYGSDPTIVCRKIRIINSLVTVVGVVPQRQAEPRWAQVWIPMSNLDPALTQTRRFHVLEVIARLEAGVGVNQAQAEMRGIAARLARIFPLTNGKVGIALTPLSLWATGEIRPALETAWAAVSLILLLACANIAHLVLVRTVQRSREIGMRAALGAGPARISRFLLAENLILALAGGTVGFLLAWSVLPLLSKLRSLEISRPIPSDLSPVALLFAGVATALCLVLFALPAVLYPRGFDLQRVITQSSGFSLTHRRSWFGFSIIALEIALAFAVVVGAGLLYRSFAALLDENTGFDSHNVLAVELPLALDWERSVNTFEQKIAPQLRRIPGVMSVAAVNCGPMMLHPGDISRFTRPLSVVGRAIDSDNPPMAQVRWTTPEYFRTLHIPLKQGRLFSVSDIEKPAYIINETLARRFFPYENPIGQRLWKGIEGPSPIAIPIIGVVGDVRDLGLDSEPAPTLYELGVSNWMILLIRSNISSTSIAGPVRAAIRAVSPGDAIARVATLDQMIQGSIDRSRFELVLLVVFAILAGVLTAVGIFGVITYSLSQRQSEFAVRLALGATRCNIWSLVLPKLMIPASIGLFAGAWFVHLFGYALRSQLHKVAPSDPAVLAASGFCILAVVFLSAVAPISRAAAISPVSVLREP